MPRGLLIQPNGEMELRDFRTHLDWQEAIGSENIDWTEPGPLTYLCYGYALYEKPLNPVATGLYRHTHPHVSDPVCGTVIALGPVKDENETDIPAHFVRLAHEIYDEMGAEKIAQMAVPLTPQEQMKIMTSMMAAQNAATRALREGKAVDFGGIGLGPESAFGPFAESPNPLLDAPLEGSRRQGTLR